MKFVRTVTEWYFHSSDHTSTNNYLTGGGGGGNIINGNSSFPTKLKHVPNICQNIQDIYTNGNQYFSFVFLFFSLERQRDNEYRRIDVLWIFRDSHHSKPAFYFSFWLSPISHSHFHFSTRSTSWIPLFILYFSLFYIRNVDVVVVGITSSRQNC